MSVRNRIALALAALLACGAVAGGDRAGRRSAAPSPSASTLPAGHPDGAILSKYCFTCHNDKRKVGGLVLENKDLDHVGPDAETWEKVVRKLRMGAMPPPGMPRPDLQTTDNFVQALEDRLDEEAALHPNPGRTQALHRLNRAEYAQRRARSSGPGRGHRRPCCRPTTPTPRAWTITPACCRSPPPCWTAI